MTEPPEPGSPLESLMLMVWRMRQDIELQKTRAVVQAVVAAAGEGEEASKQLESAWNDFLDEHQPYKRGTQKRQDGGAMEYLMEEVKRGPLKVIPLQPVGQASSKLRKRHEKGQVVQMKTQRRKRRRR
jgi:hypothetical protein